jgi:hypothetical protein
LEPIAQGGLQMDPGNVHDGVWVPS